MPHDSHANRRRGAQIVVLSLVMLVAAPAHGRVEQAKILKREPPGVMRCGVTVLVDDRSCPRGQIKRVIGGCILAGPGPRVAGPGRQRSCVPR